MTKKKKDKRINNDPQNTTVKSKTTIHKTLQWKAKQRSTKHYSEKQNNDPQNTTVKSKTTIHKTLQWKAKIEQQLKPGLKSGSPEKN